MGVATRRSSAAAVRGVRGVDEGLILTGAVVESVPGRRCLAMSPVGKREAWAYDELIEAEFLAAELLADRRPDLVEHRPGWASHRQVTATPAVNQPEFPE